MTDVLHFYIPGLLVLIGSAFTFVAAVGLLRLPDLYTRMHAASKAGTLGSCVMLIALAFHAHDPAVAMRSIVGVMFFLLTAPISAHLLAKAAHAAGFPLWERSASDEFSGDIGRDQAIKPQIDPDTGKDVAQK